MSTQLLGWYALPYITEELVGQGISSWHTAIWLVCQHLLKYTQRNTRHFYYFTKFLMIFRIGINWMRSVCVCVYVRACVRACVRAVHVCMGVPLISLANSAMSAYHRYQWQFTALAWLVHEWWVSLQLFKDVQQKYEQVHARLLCLYFI